MSQEPGPAVSIYDYVSYRHFLRDKFEELRRRNPNFSFRAFQKRAGTRSPSYLRMVMKGERNLADRGITMLANGFRLNDDERKYFGLLVKFNQAGAPEDKERYFREISENKKFLKAKPLRSAQYNLMNHWYYAAILELVRLDAPNARGVKNEKWIQSNLVPEVGLVDVKRAVREMLALGLLIRGPDGSLGRKDAMIATEDEVESLTIANFHTEMGQMAIRAARSYVSAAGLIEFRAVFNDGEDLHVTLILKGEDTVSLAVVEINSVAVGAVFDLQKSAEGCDSGSSNGASRLMDKACTQIVNCQANLTCTGCRTIAQSLRVGTDATQVDLEKLLENISNNIITVNSAMLDQCLSEIGGLSCPDIAAFSDLTDIDNLGSLRALFPNLSSACENAFSSLNPSSGLVSYR